MLRSAAQVQSKEGLKVGQQVWFEARRRPVRKLIKCTILSINTEYDDNDPHNHGLYHKSYADVKFEDGNVGVVPFSMMLVGEK